MIYLKIAQHFRRQYNQVSSTQSSLGRSSASTFAEFCKISRAVLDFGIVFPSPLYVLDFRIINRYPSVPSRSRWNVPRERHTLEAPPNPNRSGRKPTHPPTSPTSVLFNILPALLVNKRRSPTATATTTVTTTNTFSSSPRRSLCDEVTIFSTR